MYPTTTPPRSHRGGKAPAAEQAEGLHKLLRGFTSSPVSVSTPRGTLRPYRVCCLPDGRLVLRKRIEPKHELRTPPGVAVDEAALDAAQRDGLAGVVVERVSTAAVLWAPLSRWKAGLRIQRGFGPQRVLLWHQLVPVSEHSERGTLALTVTEAVSLYPARREEQLDLFSG